MMKNSKFKEMTLCITAFIPMTATLFIYSRLPPMIPMHWNMQGEIDSFMNKSYGAFVFPFMTLGILLLLWAIKVIDPRKQNYLKFEEVFFAVRLALILFFSVLQAFIIMTSLGYQFFNVSTLLETLIAILIIFLGNYLPKIKPNHLIGIRTRWTLDNDEVWYLTHRLAGKLWFGGGIILLMLAFIPGSIATYSYVTIAVALAIIPMRYSYKTFMKLEHSSKV